MIGRLFALFAYLCVATLVTEIAGVAYLRATGNLDDARALKLLAVARGEVDADSKPNHETKTAETAQASYDERQQLRDLQSRQLDMREQAVKSMLDRVRFEQRALTEEKDRHERLRTAFDEQLTALRQGALSTGRENVRLIWENIKPKQAKEQILQMVEAQEMLQVVEILSAMPIGKRAKIVAEFKTPEEVEKLGEILRLIRQGSPQVDLIDKTKGQSSKS
jgi:hypothetical protein